MLRATKHARRIHGDKQVGVMAWTNPAASLIGGKTVHQFLGVGVAPLPKEKDMYIVKRNAATRYRIQGVRVIVIDELPMMAARWFGALEYVLRQLAVPCMQTVPWGCCQVVGAFRPCSVLCLSAFDLEGTVRSPHRLICLSTTLGGQLTVPCMFPVLVAAQLDVTGCSLAQCGTWPHGWTPPCFCAACFATRFSPVTGRLCSCMDLIGSPVRAGLSAALTGSARAR